MAKRMKIAGACAALAALVAPGPVAAQNAAQQAPRNMCLLARNIDHTQSRDDKTLVFHMRNGDVWRNDLKGPCPGLKIYGYAEELHGDQVCANAQIIHPLRIGGSCVLGNFTLETKGGGDKPR